MQNVAKTFESYQQLIKAGVKFNLKTTVRLRLGCLERSREAKIKITVPAKKAVQISFKNSGKPITFVVRPQAQLTVIENCDTKTSDCKIIAGERSNVNYFIKAKNGLPQQFNYLANLKSEAKVNWYVWAKNNHDSSGQIIINQSKGSQGRISGALIAADQSQTKLDLINHHQQKNSQGDITFKILGLDQSQAQVNGLIKIEPKAAFTNSYLTQNVLLLSPDSEIKALPSLEILNDEVKASHRATIGQLDEQALFYLTSRGLSQNQAKKLLVKGFFQELLTSIDNPLIKSNFAQLI